MAPSLLSKINHFVVVMLENRSFDHMLGFLYPGKKTPDGQPFEGLTGNETNPDGKGNNVKVFQIQSTDPHPYFMPGANPGEGYNNTNAELFSDQLAPVPIVPATNQGFVTNFAGILPTRATTPNAVIPGTTASAIMGVYTPQLLPILSNLAKGYAVCDMWFSSAPTETFPNRAFVAMATSQGRVSDTQPPFTAPSIYTALGKAGSTWSVYGENALPLSRTSIADITDAPTTHFGEFKDFQAAVKNGTLANYVFLEPIWGSAGNSQHPNYDVSLGEQFLHDIYYTLFGSSLWNSTLLIITYDEHGGLYDHVPPPENAVPPDNSAGEKGFDFKRFGVRVPTVLVSPLIKAGTVYRAKGATPLDHTSILKTAELQFNVKPLTARDAAAPDFSSVLTLATPRTDDPLKGIAVPKSGQAPAFPAGPDHLEQALADAAASLPVSDSPGNAFVHTQPVFKSGADAVNYAVARFKAYDAMRHQPRPASPPAGNRSKQATGSKPTGKNVAKTNGKPTGKNSQSKSSQPATRGKKP